MVIIYLLFTTYDDKKLERKGVFLKPDNFNSVILLWSHVDSIETLLTTRVAGIKDDQGLETIGEV